MNHTSRNWAIAIMTLFPMNTITYAEIITDSTLGQSRHLSGPSYQIPAELGQQHGGNLFHSFVQFNLNNDESATFSGPNTVQNIISRVTGPNPSVIQGTLGATIPQADLYFLNPNGLIFGPKAKLDVQGAFYGTTAHYLKLGDNGRFDARHPENTVLTVAPITAFGFLENATPIVLQDAQITLSQNHDLALIGGNIDIINSHLQAPSGRIYLNSVDGHIEISTDFEKRSVNELPQNTQLTLSEKTTLSTETDSIADAGQIELRAGKITIQGQTYISTYTKESGHAGKIEIQTHDLTITDFATLTSNTVEAGKGGRIDIVATESFEQSGETLLNTSTAETDQPAGTVQIITDKFKMRDNAIIYTASESGTGAGGLVLVEAQDISLTDSSKIITNTFSEGKGGDINLIADTLSLNIASNLASGTFGKGDGGDITLQANQQFTLDDKAVIDSSTQSLGNGGNITLKVEQLLVAETATLSAESGTDNPFIQEIRRLAELANWLGAQSYGDFSKGGEAGKVCISQPGEQCDNNNIVTLLSKKIRKLPNTDCVDKTGSWFNKIGRIGNYTSPNDLQTH
jgi:filamentous hemagglutinin family protein